MADTEDEVPLLLYNRKKKKLVGALSPFLKWVLWISMWVIFIAWTTFLFMFPAEFVGGSIEWLAAHTMGTLFGATGSQSTLSTIYIYI